MKTKLFYKIFAFTFGMMLLITVLAHVLIFMIAPSENVLITSTTVTNEDVLAFSEVDMPQLITQTILKSFPLSFACCMVISLVFSFLFSKGITDPILSISTSVHQMSKLDRTAEISVISTDEIGGLANDINSLYQSLLATVYKGNIIKNLIMDCQSYTKYRPNETTGGIFVSWRRKEELPTGA